MRDILRTTTFDERLAQVRKRRRAVTTRMTIELVGWLLAGLLILAFAALEIASS